MSLICRLSVRLPFHVLMLLLGHLVVLPLGHPVVSLLSRLVYDCPAYRCGLWLDQLSRPSARPTDSPSASTNRFGPWFDRPVAALPAVWLCRYPAAHSCPHPAVCSGHYSTIDQVNNPLCHVGQIRVVSRHDHSNAGAIDLHNHFHEFTA